MGNVLVCDLDAIEIHNLTRSVLFRSVDRGRMKADVAAERMRDINPDLNVIPFPRNIAELGLGFYRRAELIFATFDAMFPRYVMNEACMLLRRPWVDGGMSILDHRRGAATVYDPRQENAACYTCKDDPAVVSEHLNGLRGQLGCNAYEQRLDEMDAVPTTPMMASMIGAMQVSAAMDLLFDDGSDDTSSPWLSKTFEVSLSQLRARAVRKKRFRNCYYHDGMAIEPIDDQVVEVDEWRSDRTTAADVLARGREEFGTENVSVLLPEIYVTRGACDTCGSDWEVFAPRSSFRIMQSTRRCATCGEGVFEERPEWPITRDVDDDFPWLHQPMESVGFRPLDVLTVLAYDEFGEERGRRYYEITGDAERFGLHMSVPGVVSM